MKSSFLPRGRVRVIVGTFLVLLAACSQTEDPKLRIVQALEALQDEKGLTLTLKLLTTVESLQSLAEERGAELDASDAERLVDS